MQEDASSLKVDRGADGARCPTCNRALHVRSSVSVDNVTYNHHDASCTILYVGVPGSCSNDAMNCSQRADVENRSRLVAGWSQPSYKAA